jgi:hypothetical protein
MHPLCPAGGLPIGKKESQDAAWQRVIAFFKETLE